MFYLLLIVPHLLAVAGLLAFAMWSSSSAGGADDDDPGRGGGEPEPPGDAQGPEGEGPPLPDAAPPRRRVRGDERLLERRSRPARRGRTPGPRRSTPSAH